MTTLALALIDEFEEIEALATVDILRRANIQVKTVSLNGEDIVCGKHGIAVQADEYFEAMDFAKIDGIIVPGGTTAYNEHSGLKAVLLQFAADNKLIAAICAAPMVLGGLGLLRDKKATCYPGFEHFLTGAVMQDGAAVVQDGNIVTGRGPGLVMEFALHLVGMIAGDEQREEVAKALLLSY